MSATTDGVAPTDRLDHWHDVVCTRFGSLDTRRTSDTEHDFEAALVGTRLGDLQISRVSGSGHEVHRTPGEIRRSPSDDFHIEIPLRGTALLSQDGREATLRPGDFALCSNARPYTYGFRSSFEELVIQVPRDTMIAVEPRIDRLTAVRSGNDVRLGAAVSALLHRLADIDTWYASPMAARFGASLVELVGTALSDQLGPTERTPARSRYLADARAYLLEHLGDPELCPAAAAQAAGISLRYLHALFHADGTTLSRWVTERRLERACRALADADQAQRSVTEIAFSVGFGSSAHFARAFKAAYGLSPRSYRQASLPTGR